MGHGRCDLGGGVSAIAQLRDGQPGRIDDRPARGRGVDEQVEGASLFHPGI
jgi:hypothetical protein